MSTAQQRQLRLLVLQVLTKHPQVSPAALMHLLATMLTAQLQLPRQHAQQEPTILTQLRRVPALVLQQMLDTTLHLVRPHRPHVRLEPTRPTPARLPVQMLLRVTT